MEGTVGNISRIRNFLDNENGEGGGTKKMQPATVTSGRLLEYPRGDSNSNRQNRNLKSYPLDYGGK